MGAHAPRIAVVGSGAAAAGVLLGIGDVAPDADVTLFELATPVPSAPTSAGDGGLDDAAIGRINASLRRTSRWAFPPPKSHFGFVPGRAGGMGAPHLWASANRGGLTTVWGGGMLPLSDRELAGWPFDAATLAPHYARIATEVGVCGEHDEVDAYFGTTHVNRPPMIAHGLAHRLRRHLAGAARGDDRRRDVRFVVGASRLALETRDDVERGCTATGECMLGCPRSSVWSATSTITAMVARLGVRVVTGQVRSFDDDRHLLVRSEDGREGTHGPYDIILLAAGAIGTTTIVLRSGARSQAAPLVDTALASFPILSLRPVRDEDEGHVALSNLTILAVPDDATERTLQASVYPVFDHLLRYYLPPSLWWLSRRIARVLRAHVLIGRVYLGASAERTYRLGLVDDEAVITPEREPDPRPALRTFLRALRSALAGSGLSVPPPGTVQRTSSHYGCTLPYGDATCGVGSDGAVAPGVHVADAAAFPTMPALSPTFTIMANAHRTVAVSLGALEGSAS